MADFLIGLGVGALVISYLNYSKKEHQGLLPTKYALWFGVMALIIGLILTFYQT